MKNRKVLSSFIVFAMIVSLFAVSPMTVSAQVNIDNNSTFTPLSVSGFNKDTIAESKPSIEFASYVDGDNAGANFAFYSQSVQSDGGLSSTGLVQKDNVKFQLQPYDRNNTLQLFEVGETKTLVIDAADQGYYDHIAILCCSGNDDTYFKAIVNYSDSSSDEQTFYSPNWAWVNECPSGKLGRIKIKVTGGDGILDEIECPAGSTYFGMYNRTIETDPTKKVMSVTFEVVRKSADIARANIYAISGVKCSGNQQPTITGLNITNTTSNGFDLSWDPKPDTGNYYVEISTDSSFSTFIDGYGENECLVTGRTNLTATGLNSNTLYYARVKATNVAGTAMVSDIRSTTTTGSGPVTTPPAITTSSAIVVVSSSSNNVTVSVNNGYGAIINNITIQVGQKIGTIEEPIRKGYIFTGWYYDKECTKPCEPDDIVKSNTTIYAGWEIDPVRQIILTVDKEEALVWNEDMTNDVAPFIVNNRTMLPIRFIAENLGAKVEWNEKEQKVTITYDDIEIVIIIGADTATVNGKTVKLDSPALIKNNRTFLPIRFVSENLGATVEWDAITKRVTITKDVE